MRRVHIIGIGGIGLSAIARVLLARGVQVSGSDAVASATTNALEKEGARVFIGHRAENVGEVDYVLVTSAAREDNAEVSEARRRGIRVGNRYEFFPMLTAHKQVIAVAGTHGKTTTSAMVALILERAGLDPTAIVGGIVREWGSNTRLGNSDYMVIEADEYERAFLGLTPSLAIVTSIEMDHPDIFLNESQVRRAFHQFMRRVSRDGALVVNGDSAQVTRQTRGASARVVRYGLGARNRWRARELRRNKFGGNDFDLWRGRTRIGEFALRIPGKHNVANALAAIALAGELGIDWRVARDALWEFRGAARRFEVKGEFGGVTIVDDYAHHPTEIRATLAAAREQYREPSIWAVFQPHTYSRTRALLDEFARAFEDADHVIITDIYAARELADARVSSHGIVERMRHPDVQHVATLDAAARGVLERIQSGAVLITLGAGDVYRVGEQVGQELHARARR